MTRRIGVMLAALTAVLVLAGCIPFIKTVTATQDAAVAGPVRIAIEFCDDDSFDCLDAPIGGSNQILAAYAIPEGARVLSVKTTGTKALTLAESASYTDWLAANVAAPSGLRWVGFRSATVGDVTGADPKWTITAEIDPPGRSGSPVTPFTYIARLGYRSTTPATENDPVDCAAGACPVLTGFNAAPVPALDAAIDVRDLGLAPHDGVAVDRGTRTDVPVTVRYAGVTGSGSLAPAVGTTIPGASASAPSIDFASTGEKSLPVTLDVPASAAPGDYEVAVTVAGRSVTVPVHVDVPPVPVLDVSSVVFPSTRVGKANGPRNVLVTNSGTRALDMRRASVTGPQADEFRIAADECAGRTLRPGRDCIVALEFGPYGGGGRSASLQIPNSFSDATVPLSGVGAVVPGHKDVFVTIRGLRVQTRTRAELVEDGMLVFEQDFPIVGDVSWRLRQNGRLVGSLLKDRIEPAGTRGVSLRLSRRGKRIVARSRGHLVLTTAFTDADGRRSVVRRMVVLDN